MEDGLQQLDMLTKEENLMTAARTLGIASDIRHDSKVIKDDTRDIKDDTRNISNNLEVNKRGAPHPFSVFKLVLIFTYHMLIAINELQRMLRLDAYYHRLLLLKRAHREPVPREASNMALPSRSFRQSQYCMRHPS